MCIYIQYTYISCWNFELPPLLVTRGVQKFLLERRNRPEKGGGVDVEMGNGGGGVTLFYYFAVQSHLLCVGGN